MKLVSLFASLLLTSLVQGQETAEYGADVSFPVHHHGELKDGPLGDRREMYENFMQGCRDFYGDKGDRCDLGERDRVEMSLRQAQSVVVSCCS
jgi:prolyl 4-hydroxylase